jgi:hypothetical protein
MKNQLFLCLFFQSIQILMLYKKIAYFNDEKKNWSKNFNVKEIQGIDLEMKFRIVNRQYMKKTPITERLKTALNTERAIR